MRFARAVDAATTGFAPDLVMISAGFDSLPAIRSAGSRSSTSTFEELTRFLVERAEEWCGGRVVSALEGGYAPERLAVACVRHMMALE